MTTEISKQSWLVWFIATSFFSFQFVLRLFPGLMMHELMTQYNVGAMDFGVLSASYYLGYSGLQIPIGMMLDRYNPRNIISLCALTCSLGLFAFVFSTHWSMVVFGRFLIGAGSAAGFLGAAKIVRSFFPESRFTLMIGISFSLGLLGALYGGKPTNALIEQFGWQRVLELLGWASLIIAAAIFFLFPRVQQKEKNPTPILSFSASIRELLHHPKLFGIAFGGALMVGPLEGFADAWGVSFLVNAHGYAKSEASLIISFIYFGMLFGGPILSYFAQRYNAFYSVAATCGFAMSILFTLLLMGSTQLTFPYFVGIMTLIGIFCCYQVIVFSLAVQVVPPHLSGLATSVTNCVNMMAGSFFHLSMGWIMDYRWSGTMKNGIKIYDEQSYVSAIMILPILLMAGFFVFSYLKRKPDSLEKAQVIAAV